MTEKRNCAHCGGPFVAKKSQIDAGAGKYCSHRCATDAGAHANLTSKANLERAAAARRASIAVNGTKHKRGPENPSWRGGPEESRKRKVVHDVAYTREYRKRNPQMMREAKQKRRGLGRLPKGTVNRIGESQKWKCVVCRVPIKEAYHMDHIQPIARGGKHEPGNIQLLCRTCNLRKNAKDPVKFMQEKGFLL